MQLQALRTAELARVFHYSIYGLAAFASAVMTWAEGETLPVGLVIPTALLALFLNEEWQRVQLSAVWSNLLGLGALVLSAFEFVGDNPEGKLLAGAHLLAYLQCILLFQRKQNQQYWWICALCLLQLAVSAVLTDSAWFGLWLTLFVILAIWTVSVFSLLVAAQQFGRHEALETVSSSSEPTTRLDALATNIAQTFKRWVGGDGLSLAGNSSRRARSTVQDSIQHEPGERWINPQFVAGVLALSGAAMVIGGCFFILVPRVWLADFSPLGDLGSIGGGRSVSGFNENIRLGDMGEILESTEPALQLRLFDTRTNQRLDVATYTRELGYDEPLFRGAVLTRYRNGGWQLSPPQRMELTGNPVDGIESVRQDYKLLPQQSTLLFSIPPTLAGRLQNLRRDAMGRMVEETIAYNPENSVLWRSGPPSNSSIEYTLISPRQRRDVEATEPAGGMSRYLQLPADALTRLRALARDLTRPENLRSAPGASTTAAKARVLESHLRDSGIYAYSLDQTIQDNEIDPVEDFLFNRKSGHCEYYASALALLLRAVDIPSRVISGYKGGDINASGDYFEVQQRHAHTWVEALLDNRWVTLDATPAAERAAMVENVRSQLSWWTRVRAAGLTIWQDYVLNMSLLRQQQEIYQPLRETAREGLTRLSESQGLVTGLFAWLRSLWGSPARWFSWQGGLTAFVLMATLAGMIRAGRWLWRSIATWRLGRAAGLTGARLRIEFYERFERLMARAGLLAAAHETQREFAVSAAQTLGMRSPAPQISSVPAELTEQFYRVRFGAAQLTTDEESQLSRQLDDLELALHHNGRGQADGAGELAGESAGESVHIPVGFRAAKATDSQRNHR